jgi:hypothetical protein
VFDPGRALQPSLIGHGPVLNYGTQLRSPSLARKY